MAVRSDPLGSSLLHFHDRFLWQEYEVDVLLPRSSLGRSGQSNLLSRRFGRCEVGFVGQRGQLSNRNEFRGSEWDFSHFRARWEDVSLGAPLLCFPRRYISNICFGFIRACLPRFVLAFYRVFFAVVMVVLGA